VLAVAGAAGAQDVPVRIPREALRPLEGVMTCPVTGKPHRQRLHAARYRGRIYYTCSEEALRKFLSDPDRYARTVEPRAALFDAPDPSRPASGAAVLWLGVYAVIALVCGALAAYLAVPKGLSGTRWFAAGLLLNVVGVGLAVARPARPLPFPSRGLTKIPATRAPVSCPACGGRNHPAAAACSTCGAPVEPVVESEVARARPSEGA